MRLQKKHPTAQKKTKKGARVTTDPKQKNQSFFFSFLFVIAIVSGLIGTSKKE